MHWKIKFAILICIYINFILKFLIIKDLGYRQIDTAILYENHKMIGNSLKTMFNEGKYKREDIFITTKVLPLKNINSI